MADAAIKKPARELDYEDLFAALDRLQRDCTSTCEVSFRPIIRGVQCTITIGGKPTQARGQHTDEALAACLDELGALS